MSKMPLAHERSTGIVLASRLPRVQPDITAIIPIENESKIVKAKDKVILAESKSVPAPKPTVKLSSESASAR